MKQIYNFEAKQPPVISEEKLREELQRRELRRQIFLLRVASLLCWLCMALFAFFILRDSMIAAAFSVILLTVTIIGNGMISLVFYRHGMRDHQ